MNEKEFKEKLERILQKELGNDVKIERDKNLIYKVIVNEKFSFKPDTPKAPKRGMDNYAFQTDLLIKDNKMENKDLPLVVIETKYGGFSTHDVLTYSTKAQRHKEIYPYLRYGLVVGGKNTINDKFFTHNIGFDFACALRSIDNANLIKDLAKIINQQVKSARSLLNILKNKRNKIKKFSTIIRIEYDKEK